MRLAKGWQDYQILATGDGLKLERWGNVLLLRPDPQVIWASNIDMLNYSGLNARYLRKSSGGGEWQILKEFAPEWTVNYADKYKFLIKPMGFKHTGLFPEQSINWLALSSLVEAKKNSGNFKNKPIEILNLFGYTGAATVALALAGARVTHVDAAKGMVERCKFNCNLNAVPQDAVRYIVDDCEKFVIKETRRGKKYDAILMDPPSYGRGPNGEMFRLEDNIYNLVNLTKNILSDAPIFYHINSYTTGLQPTVLNNILSLVFTNSKVDSFELCLPTENAKVHLPCGCSGVAVFS